MSQTIECPSCEKRFRLGDRPPATYSCNQCGTVMDLSDFGGRTAEPAAPAAPAAPATRTQRRQGATTARSGGGGGAPARSRGRGAPSAARGRGRGRAAASRRRREDYDEYDDEGYAPRGRPQSSNAGLFLILGSLGIVVLALIIALKSKKDPVEEESTKTTARGTSNPGVVNGMIGTNAGVRPGVPSGVGTAVGGSMPVANNGGGNAGGNNAGGTVRPPRKKRIGRHNVKRYKFEVFPWPDEVDADTRAKVEDAIVSMYRGDRASRDARKYLVGVGRAVGGRLVSEYHTIANTETFESKEGRMKAKDIDATLRMMDGWMERYWDEDKTIQITTPPDTVVGLAKRWIVWWKEGYWKSRPSDPWDPMTDRYTWEQDKKGKAKSRPGRKGWDKRDK